MSRSNVTRRRVPRRRARPQDCIAAGTRFLQPEGTPSNSAEARLVLDGGGLLYAAANVRVCLVQNSLAQMKPVGSGRAAQAAASPRTSTPPSREIPPGGPAFKAPFKAPRSVAGDEGETPKQDAPLSRMPPPREPHTHPLSSRGHFHPVSRGVTFILCGPAGHALINLALLALALLAGIASVGLQLYQKGYSISENENEVRLFRCK